MDRIFDKLDRYFSCGWHLAVLDLVKGRWILAPAHSLIGYLKAENANGRHILIQPRDPSCYLLVDDLSWDLILRHHRKNDGKWKPGRMVVETSPRNYQVWIHGQSPLCLEDKRYWLKRLLSDPGADPHDRWGRCPGFRNRKEVHRTPKGEYPLSRLIWVDWVGRAAIPKTHPKSPPIPLGHSFPSTLKGGVCHRSICRLDYERGDESQTDFSYALALMRRGYTNDQVRSRILNERRNWHHHCGHGRINAYLDRTIGRASSVKDSHQTNKLDTLQKTSRARSLGGKLNASSHNGPDNVQEARSLPFNQKTTVPLI